MDANGCGREGPATAAALAHRCQKRPLAGSSSETADAAAVAAAAGAAAVAAAAPAAAVAADAVTIALEHIRYITSHKLPIVPERASM